MDIQLQNILTGVDNNNLVEVDGFLLEETTAENFNKLKINLQKLDPEIELSIYSAHRSFTQQLSIWNEKASFHPDRPIRHLDGKIVDRPQRLLPHEITQLIMRWSAIPGASRHHWGTDIDIYDANAINKRGVNLSEVELIPSEYDLGGYFDKLTRNLNKLIKIDKSCGFFRPYQDDHGAIAPEPWHISYKPLSDEYTKKYTLKLFKEIVRDPRVMYFSELKKRDKALYKHFVKLSEEKFPGFLAC
jgi:hypothetical protein